MSSDKLEKNFKLFTQYNFDTIKSVSDKLKCGKCRKILIEACQTQCGCRFCRGCVDEMIKNGCQFCPGNTSDCRVVSLSTVVIDYRANNKISKLIMKCPEQMCFYECELLEMSEHLRICTGKSIPCQFYKFDMNNKMKNEVRELKENEKKNNEEINKLKIDLQLTNEKLESINTEMEIMKIDKVEMEKHVKNVEEILNEKIVNLISKHEKEIKSICKNDNIELIKSDLDEKIEMLVTNLDNKINEFELINKCDAESFNDKIGSEIKEFKQSLDKIIMQMKIKPIINPLEKCVKNKTNGIFELLIEKIDKLKNHRGIWSEYFYNPIQPYKTRLYISLSSHNEMQISFCICDDKENRYLSFPFKADVTIKLINKNQREVSKSITKYCQIEIPEIDSFVLSDYFIFSLSELRENEIVELNCSIIQCSIEFK